MLRFIAAAIMLAANLSAAERICYERDLPDTTVAKACVTIGPAVRQALNDHIASTQGRYRGRAHLIFETLNNLFANVLSRFPSGAVAQARADRMAAETAEKTAQDAALPTVPSTEP